MGMNPRSSLCWDCKNAVCKGCTWAEKYEPVAGWNAEQHTVDGQISYCVIDCPEFIRDSYHFGRYSPEQYIEHLEKLVERMKGKIEWYKDEINRMLAEGTEPGPKSGRPRKRFTEADTKQKESKQHVKD